MNAMLTPWLRRTIVWPLFALALAPLLASSAPLTEPPDQAKEMAKETISVVFCMENGHYLNKPLAQFDQRKLLDAYMSDLDPRHLFLLQTDADGFKDQFAPTLVHNVRELGNLDPAYAIFQKFHDRVSDRVAWINKRLEGDFDFTTKDTYAPDRDDAPWPATAAEADQLWDKQLRYELINEILAEETRQIDAASDKAKADAEKSAAGAAQSDATPAAKDDATPPAPAPSNTTTAAPADATPAAAPAAKADDAPKTFVQELADAKDVVRKRYANSLRSLDETEANEVQEVFLNTLAGQYDPHSNFFSEYELDEFNIEMNNALVGIGAVLNDKDGYCEVSELLPNGPAEKSGQIHPGDKIVAVGQADGDMVDVVGVKLRKTVNLIRGPEGSNVRLLVVPASDPGEKKPVTLKREEIKLTASLAKAQIIDLPVGNETVPIGVIDLPTFYGKSGEGDNFSTTDDVRELIGKLKKAGVQGIIMDLRRNGGGFLDEAIDLTGLFIPPSPVLQVRDTLGALKELSHDDPTVDWDGPLILLVSKQSASATEILTGALQDYHRALVVGDHTTHGKGTVQAVYHFNVFDPDEKGAAKVTIQKWYLPDGNSIQIKGITADIPLPSDIDFLPIGESDEKNALGWDSVKPLPLTLPGDGAWRASLLDNDLITQLRQDSEARENALPEFDLLKQRVAWEKSRDTQKEFSLNFADRMQQRKDDIAFRDQLNARMEVLAKNNFKSTEVLLDAAIAQNKDSKDPAKTPADDTDPDDPESADADNTPPVNFDIQLREGVRIMGDWLQELHDPNQQKLDDAAAKVADASAKNADAAAPAAAKPPATAGATTAPASATP